MYCIGVDVSARRGHDVAVIRCPGEFVAMFKVHCARDVAGICDEYLPACVAVDSPSGPATGLMRCDEYRAKLKPPPRRGTYLNCRVCEYEVRRRGLSIYFTPERGLRKWVLEGVKVFDELGGHGFGPAPEGREGGRCIVEYYPYASFCCLAGELIAPTTRSEGWTARKSLLSEHVEGVCFAELSEDQLDALVGAVTARAVVNGKAGCVGDPCEGTIWTPVPLLDRYTRGRRRVTNRGS